MEILQENGEVLVRRPSDAQHHRALHGLTRALLNNMVTGVVDGYQKQLEVQGVGYRVELEGDGSLSLQLGFSHMVQVAPPDGVSFDVEPRTKVITVSGIDKEVVGQTAADIRAWRPPEPYKGKGIRYVGEHVRHKAGKAGKVI
jgi:large subunit ribosomal protein L6